MRSGATLTRRRPPTVRSDLRGGRHSGSTAEPVSSMRLHCYVIARDLGFAPNPFYGVCTLATCKPDIRARARVGDWVLGWGSANYSLTGRLVFAMCVERAVSFEEYWANPEFRMKRPIMNGSLKQLYGDNIYHRKSEQTPWLQEDSHHSLPTGALNPLNVVTDTRVNRALLSRDFAYWGGEAIEVPEGARLRGDQDLAWRGQGYRYRWEPELVAEFVAWFRGLDDHGYCGDPAEFAKHHRLLPGFRAT